MNTPFTALRRLKESLKTVGMIIIAISGIYLCTQRLRAIENKLCVVRGLCALIRYSKVQVENYSMPCAEIISRCPAEVLRLCGYTEDIPPSSFEELYCAIDIPDGESSRIFSEFVGDMGGCYREEQIRRCEEFFLLMSEREKNIAERMPAERKLTVALFVSAVLAVLILTL